MGASPRQFNGSEEELTSPLDLGTKRMSFQRYRNIWASLNDHTSESVSQKACRGSILHPLNKRETCIKEQHHRNRTFLSGMGFKCYVYVFIFKSIIFTIPDSQGNLKSIRYC